eukprot:scaffold79158_cov94-Cyclotella_meneghiniana.AAC.3
MIGTRLRIDKLTCMIKQQLSLEKWHVSTNNTNGRYVVHWMNNLITEIIDTDKAEMEVYQSTISRPLPKAKACQATTVVQNGVLSNSNYV